MEHYLFFDQRLFIEKEYYKWKKEIDCKSGFIALDSPMLVVCFLQSRGYIDIDKIIEDWRKTNGKEMVK